MDFSTGVREKLRIAGAKVLTGREVNFSIIAEIDRSSVVFRVRVLWILIEDEFTAGNRSVEGAIGGKSGKAVSIRIVIRIENVVVMIVDEVRIEHHIHDSLVDRGDLVRQGQIVGKIEDGVEVAALARARATNEYATKSAEARVRFLRRKHERMSELHTKSISSLASLEEAEAEVQVAEQQLREAHLNRELANLEVARAEEVLINALYVARSMAQWSRITRSRRVSKRTEPGAHPGAARSAAGRSLRANRALRANSCRQRRPGAARTANWRRLCRESHRS